MVSVLQMLVFISPVLSGGACTTVIDVAAPLRTVTASRKGRRENI